MTRGEINQLLVIWRDRDEQPHAIGHLGRRNGRYQFWYDDHARALAAEQKFVPLTMFPELRGEDAPYESEFLFPVFAQRMPSPQREDSDAFLKAVGVEHRDDPFEVLAMTRGMRATDRFELGVRLPPRDAEPVLLTEPEWRRVVEIARGGQDVTVDVFRPTTSSDPRVVSDSARRAAHLNRRKLFVVDADVVAGVVDQEQAKQILEAGARFLAHEARRP